MDAKELRDRVEKIVMERAPLRRGDGARDTDNLVDDLNLDSYDRVEIAMDIEHEFHIEVDESKSEFLGTFGQLVAYVEGLVNAQR